MSEFAARACSSRKASRSSFNQSPATWTATTRHKEAEGSAYYRHYYMGLLREDGSPKLALNHFPAGLGICQWFHFEDHRLDSAVEWLRKLGVSYLRTGLSWADSFRPGAEAWFDRQMQAVEEFSTTLTLCFTPEHLGVVPHYTSPPHRPEEFAEFASRIVRRYAPEPKSAVPANLDLRDAEPFVRVT